MDIFLDTGPIFGNVDHEDKFHPICISFYKEYPLDKHNFCTTHYIVNKELKNILDNRQKKGNLRVKKTIRLIGQLSREMLSKIGDVDYRSHSTFPPLYGNINAFLEARKQDSNPKDRDAILLTNAFLWDRFAMRCLQPKFFTTDKRDIGGDNKADLIANVESLLRDPIRLDICLLWDFENCG
ncbi:MAG TPA: hypothetical protein HA349_03240 [Methanotrichaceae archaeon]|nr:hypothetical protein [Methanotrichaceae archaeon]